MKYDPFSLEGRVAVVTGGGRGIGKAISSKLAEAGAEVVLADCDEENAKKTAEQLTGQSGNVTGRFVEVAEKDSVSDLFEKTFKTYGQVDILVNNAGIMYRTRFTEIKLDEWERTVRVNLTGAFLCTQAVIPLMKESGFGRIVNISSSAGRSVSTLGGAHYTASKAGLLGLTRAAGRELAAYGITVNAVCPGLIDTKMARDTTTPGEIQGFLDSFPIQRLGLPDEIGRLVVFLCSEDAAYITGASIDINGGDLMI
ncbi:MAG: SDR family NAD(P)-dependent oxidoreductase [Candidatus Aminicenantes bacterium]|jgi:NAD(P)-dependent dehydrogenase (short-subunit alcohol dehydrogenase family)